MSIKSDLLQKKFIDSSIELAKLQMNEQMKQKEKDLRMNMVWRNFNKWVYDNFEEK